MKLKDDAALRFDGIAVDQSGLIAPLAEGLGNDGKQVLWTENQFHVFNATILGDSGSDADGGVRAGRDLRRRRIDAGDELADDDFLVAMEGPAGVRGGHVHGTLDVRGKGGRLEDAFAGQTEIGCLVARRQVDLKGTVGWRVHLNDGLKSRSGWPWRKSGTGRRDSWA